MFCKIIAYNVTVLIHAMFELGIMPDFLKILFKPIFPNKSANDRNQDLL